jgi:hypothetical protein
VRHDLLLGVAGLWELGVGRRCLAVRANAEEFEAVRIDPITGLVLEVSGDRRNPDVEDLGVAAAPLANQMVVVSHRIATTYA